MGHRHHAIDYIELPAPELETAKAFYGSAFGWTFNDYGDAYAGIVDPEGDGEIGGLNPGDEPGRTGSLVIIWSDDLDATQAAIEAAGGQIIVPIFDFPGGRRFHFTDPAGNALAVWAEQPH